MDLKNNKKLVNQKYNATKELELVYLKVLRSILSIAYSKPKLPKTQRTD